MIERYASGGVDYALWVKRKLELTLSHEAMQDIFNEYGVGRQRVTVTWACSLSRAKVPPS